MINKHKSNKIKENTNTMRHLNNGTDHRHSKSCCDQSSPARRTMTVRSHDLHNLWSRAICRYWPVSMLSGNVPVLSLAINVLDPRSSRKYGISPMTLTGHCKFVTLTSFGRPWIVFVVLICQDRLQHCGKFHWPSPGASVVVQTGQPYRTYAISPWCPRHHDRRPFRARS